MSKNPTFQTLLNTRPICSDVLTNSDRMEATTAAAKRKRTVTDIPADEAPAAADEVSDAEVEEFYAIIRRMREASRRAPPRAPAWRPSFSWEDFETPRAPAPPQPDERVAENCTPPRPDLDLNAEPEPDTPATPQSAPAPAPV